MNIVVSVNIFTEIMNAFATAMNIFITAGNTLSSSTTGPTLQSSNDDHTPNSIGEMASTQLAVFEAPSQTLMCNEAEGDPWMVEISLMFTQDATSFFQPNSEVVCVSKRGVVKSDGSVKLKNEKSLRELLEEQDIGEYDV